MRTLWDERFSRNEDGSYKVILVEPCLVGTKNIEDIGKNEPITVCERKTPHGRVN